VSRLTGSDLGCPLVVRAVLRAPAHGVVHRLVPAHRWSHTGWATSSSWNVSDDNPGHDQRALLGMPAISAIARVSMCFFSSSAHDDVMSGR
jgi:hypothetical protein